MPFLRSGLNCVILGLVLVSLSGCLAIAAAGAAGAGVAYASGDTVNSVEGSPQQVAAAAEQAFLQLGMVVISSSAGQVDAEVRARTARDTKVEVTAKAETDRLTRVSVRADVFGDEALQNRVFAKIQENLAMAQAPTAVQTTDN
jgi:hypothetical protein